MELNATEQAALDKLKQHVVVIPVDAEGNTRAVEVWRAVSVLDWESKHYHLHPELFNQATEVTYLCGDCYKAILNKGERPEISIAGGIDFGDYTRIGLEKPNLHEQSIISRFRRYGKVVKVKPNNRGQIKYTMHKIQGHVVLFEHDAPYVASRSFQTIEDMKDHIGGVLRLHYVTADGNVDKLIKAVLGASTIVGRSWVLYQWLAVLRYLHVDFSDIELPPYEDFRKLFDEAIKAMQKNATYTTASTDPIALTGELTAGSDVAAEQQIDSTRPDAPTIPPLGEDNDTLSNNESTRQNEVPLSYSYVADRVDAGTSNEKERNAILLHAIGNSFNELDR
jgi:hypothetical protein